MVFGTGEVKGELNADTMTFGDIKIDGQMFGEIVNEIGDVFAGAKFVGILGLSYDGMAAYGMKPVFTNIIDKKLLKSNLLAFYYSTEDGKDGEISIGKVDPTKFVGEITYYPVTDKYYWTIQADDIRIGKKTLGLCPEKCNLILDTGTTLLTAPSADFRKLILAMPIETDCTGYNSAPPLVFVIGGKEYSLETPDYVIKSTVGSEEKCTPALMPLDVPEDHGPAWIIGDIFMQKYYTVFNRDTDEVGLALAKN